jgi:excisionase family DNA binding protein
VTQLPNNTEAYDPPTGHVIAYFDGRDHLGENLSRKVALLKAVFGFDEHTGRFKPLPPKPFCQDIFQYIFFGKLLRQRARKVACVRPPFERGTVGQAAAILGLKPRKLQAMAQRGDIPGTAKLGRQWTFDLAKLRRFVEQQGKETACRSSAKPRPDATGAAKFYGVALRSAGGSSGGRLKQMIRQSQKRVAKQGKSGH